MNKEKEIELVIRDPHDVYFLGSVLSFSSHNETGPFDVLSEHENFISIIKDKLSYRSALGEINEMTIERGVLKVEGNRLEVYLGVEIEDK